MRLPYLWRTMNMAQHLPHGQIAMKMMMNLIQGTTLQTTHIPPSIFPLITPLNHVGLLALINLLKRQSLMNHNTNLAWLLLWQKLAEVLKESGKNVLPIYGTYRNSTMKHPQLAKPLQRQM